MRIPNSDRAVVDIAKLQDYCLDESHPRGKHKARVFKASLGLTSAHSASLRSSLLEGVRSSENAKRSDVDEFGQRFMLDLVLEGPKARGTVRTAWIIRVNEDFPRLVSCYVLEES